MSSDLGHWRTGRVFSSNDTAVCVRTLISLVYEQNFSDYSRSKVIYWSDPDNWLDERP
jgi:hypothetical protein